MALILIYRNMVYEHAKELVTANRENIHATTRILAAGGETDVDSLAAAVESVISTATRSKIKPNLPTGFTNCLDYTLWAL